MTLPDDFVRAWHAVDAAFRGALAEAWTSLVSRGLPVGAVVSSRDGVELAKGRNRVYDPRGGSDPLQKTPLAHAEMNALAAVPSDTDLSRCILYSTHQPCSMCQAAADFIEVGEVRFLVSDPSAVEPSDRYSFTPDVDGRFGLGANVMFLHNIAWVAGPDSEILAGNRVSESGAVELALQLEETGIWRDSEGLSIETALAGIWDELTDLASRREAAE